ncbi:uncharacterized protein TrAFT101_008559 [Trichoderma asperellum]|uniref:ZW10 C-terminal helical domain-containing protein n=1 Tax=Trichoderma asperellum (strain ATCC 204424 / CBS 433.97 / NBRC 101777) TaxID=1042311 RepID=A0A2T3ZC24_TRIA4|nr:hypothetical protein M441DRAFT_165518 [Trichoderma asperellum CBS 433.97]PTB42349.1 hypothetical protein M441DRAFT_165518 [Trichoderma asperellum CBS 433.97]UKZ93650.1 hypothetical protein TrAFT101_008559 [Trichoderma asperellum]
MATATEPQQLSSAIISFTLDGNFPEGASALLAVSETDLGPTIAALDKAKVDIEAEIHTINEETKDDISSWVKNSKVLQEDIVRSKTIANEIILQSEAPEVTGEAIQDAEEKADFLNREVQYSQQMHNVLRRIQHVNQLLAEVEQASRERRVLDSLRLLEKSWAALDDVGVSKTTRVMRLLDLRAFELKSDIHQVFDHVWKTLVQIDTDSGKVAIYNTREDEKMSLEDAAIGLQAYKEVDERMEQLWHNLDAAVVSPRMNALRSNSAGIKVEGDVLELAGSADGSAESLLSDLEQILTFIAQKLPANLLQPLANIMMSDIISKLTQEWLNPAVPSGLRDLDKFQALVSKMKGFCEELQRSGYTGLEQIQDWASKAPTIWLEKCRETSLNSVRVNITSGIGESKRVEKIERQMVSIAEGKELSRTGAGAVADTNDWGDDWGEAWDDDKANEPTTEANDQKDAPGGDDDDTADAWGWDDNEDGNKDVKMEEEPAEKEAAEADDGDDGADAWGWGDNDDAKEDVKQAAEAKKATEIPEEDDGADAWGWGDDAGDAAPAPAPAPAAPASAPTSTARKTRPSKAKEETRELVFKETYSISSMPEPVLELIFSILEDGAALTKDTDEYSLLTATAPGLFSLPTFVLALFRAISPHYYSSDAGGNMFLYNDAMYLAEKLSDFSLAWKQREDLTPRARSMLRIDNDVRTLKSFANRSYANEMSLQKTILHDLLGGSQSLAQQDDKDASIEAGTARIRNVAATWEPILKRSVWSQAVGSLADSLASRIISDVLEMSSIGQDEAFSIAQLIALATELDDLFIPSKLAGTAPVTDEMPTTAQYAPNWLRLKYLGEVLQSNLNEVKFLWCDSELSLYFTVDEVIDLIHASFEDNARTRGTIKEISAKEPLAR